VFLRQAGEIEVGKDIAQQDQALKAIALQHTRRFACMTRLCTQVQVGEDQRVVGMQIHIYVLTTYCYWVINTASILVHGNWESNQQLR